MAEIPTIVCWVRDGNGDIGYCRTNALNGIRCAMRGEGKFRAVICTEVGVSAKLRKGDVAVAEKVYDHTNPPIPDFFPGLKIISLVRRKEVNASLETFEFGTRKLSTTS